MGITFSIDSLEDMCDAMCDNNVPEHKAGKMKAGYEVKVVVRGNCMLCGKKLTDSLFFCKECEKKNRKREMNEDSN